MAALGAGCIATFTEKTFLKWRSGYCTTISSLVRVATLVPVTVDIFECSIGKIGHRTQIWIRIGFYCRFRNSWRGRIHVKTKSQIPANLRTRFSL